MIRDREFVTTLLPKLPCPKVRFAFELLTEGLTDIRIVIRDQNSLCHVATVALLRQYHPEFTTKTAAYVGCNRFFQAV